MKPEQIKTADPFASLFAINPQDLDGVQEDMLKNGFDGSQPLTIWAEQAVLIDGHTRLAAAKNLGLEEVPVYEKSFADEDAALAYGIHAQRNRRNLTAAAFLRCVKALGSRRERGGDHKSLEYHANSKAQSCAFDPGKVAKAPNGAIGKSAEDIAKLIGTSTRKVEQARTVLTHAPKEVIAAVKAEKMSVNRAYQEIMASRKSRHQPETTKHRNGDRRGILHKALNELRPWREKYKDYPELSAIFKAIDGCGLDLEQKEAGPQAEEAAHAPEKPGPCPPP
ncbi:MAG: hypothetical protein ACUVXF_10470 [Desulfobaccales bacterium]